MTFREIQIGDVDALFSIRVATWHNSNGANEMAALGITHDSVGQMLREHTCCGWICECDGSKVGFTMGNVRTGEMWVIAVLKEYEGRGIGRRLLRLIEESLHSHGWKKIWLTTDMDESVRAVGFYRHVGWQDWKIEGGDRYLRKLTDERPIHMQVKVTITRYISDEPQPGIVECELLDAHGRVWKFIEKTAIPWCAEYLDNRSSYPQPGALACIEIRRTHDSRGREVVRIDTSEPWGCESVEGESQFDVFGESLEPEE